MSPTNASAFRTRRAATIPAVKAALVTMATTALAGRATVYYGAPGDGMSFPHMIFRNVEADDDWADLGNGGREENYTIEWFLAWRAAGGTSQEATEAAFGLWALFEAALLKDPSVGGLVHWALPKIRRVVEDPSDQARITWLHGGIVVKARI